MYSTLFLKCTWLCTLLTFSWMAHGILNHQFENIFLEKEIKQQSGRNVLKHGCQIQDPETGSGPRGA